MNEQSLYLVDGGIGGLVPIQSTIYYIAECIVLPVEIG